MSENLICLLVKEDFGETAAKIVHIIHQNGELNLTEIVIHSQLPFKEVKHAVIVLIKHNIIVFFNKANPPNTDKNLPPTDLIEDFVYKVSVPDILYRIRYKITSST